MSLTSSQVSPSQKTINFRLLCLLFLLNIQLIYILYFGSLSLIYTARIMIIGALKAESQSSMQVEVPLIIPSYLLLLHSLPKYTLSGKTYGSKESNIMHIKLLQTLAGLMLLKLWKLFQTPPPGNGQLKIEECLGIEIPVELEKEKIITKGELRFLQWNARTFTWGKLIEIQPITEVSDVILIQESGSRLPRIPGFQLANHIDKGKGCAIYVRQEIEYFPIDTEYLQRCGNEGDFIVSGLFFFF